MAKLNLSEIGKTGLSEFSGQIQDDFLRELRGKEAYKRYNEMRLNSPIVAALLMAIEQPIRKIEWMFEADTDNDPRIQFLEDALDGMSLSWQDHLTEALTMLPFGYSLFEIVYRRNGGRVVWRKFAIRGQDTVNRWLFDDEGGLAGFEQSTYPAPVTIPIEKLLLYRTRVERNNPEGRSILRPAWIPYYYLKHIQQIEAIGIERDLAGMPVIKMPQGANGNESDSNSDASKANKIVRNIRNDEQAGVVVPFGWDFQLASAGGSRQFDTDKIIRRYESRILMSSLAQFLVLGQDSVGSLALSSDQTDFFAMSVNATADIISDTFSHYAIPRLLELNGMNTDGIRMIHTPAGDADISKIADFLQKAQSFITWMPDDEVWLRDTAGLPEADVKVLEEKQAAKEEAAQALKERLAQPKQEQPSQLQQPPQQPQEKMTVYTMSKAQRTRVEQEWEDALQKFFKKQQARALKAARDMQAPMIFGTVPVPQPPIKPAKPQPINVTVYVPEGKPPIVNMEAPVIPSQQPPIVNVAVNPTPVTVENTVNVPEQPAPSVSVTTPPAQVVVQDKEPKRVRATQDRDGNWTMEAEE